MTVDPSDALVGAIALEYVLGKFKPQLEDDPDFRGAFHVLSGFSAEQLAGFILARIDAGERASRLRIQFPEFELRSHGIPALYTTTESSVNVRNRERDGSITLTAELEADAEASLADSDRTDASDLKEFTPRLWDRFAKIIEVGAPYLRRRLFRLGQLVLREADGVAGRIANQGFDGDALGRFAEIARSRCAVLLDQA